MYASKSSSIKTETNKIKCWISKVEGNSWNEKEKHSRSKESREEKAKKSNIRKNKNKKKKIEK